MGQVQFLPSTFLAHAVDFDGDGHRDIWRSDADALASIAAYLKDLGWNPAVSLGYEVRLPEGFDLTRYAEDLSDFSARGARRADGRDFPSNGRASLYLPGGLGGPFFLLTDNFEVIRATTPPIPMRWPSATSPTGSMGLPSQRPWPTGAPRLDNAGIKALQIGLAAKGFYQGHGRRAGPKLREAVRRYQIATGLPADGYASPALLATLKDR